MINPEDIKAGLILGHADAALLRDALKRAEAAEAKLICNIIYQVRLLDGGENSLEWVEVTEEEFNTPTTEKYGKWEHRKLFTRPAPAADLVPPKINEEKLQEMCNSETPEFYRGFANGANWMRLDILRKIEEQSK